jgi:hypothetical protein
MNTEGDPAKRPPECTAQQRATACPHIRCTYEGWESETYECERCGKYFKLYYEDMA